MCGSDAGPKENHRWPDIRTIMDSVGAGIAAVDEARLLDNMGGSREILIEASQVFLDDVGTMLVSLKDAAQSGSAHKIERAAHLIKGALLSMAAPRAVELAASIEKRARAGETAFGDAIDAFSDEVARVGAAIAHIVSAG